MPKCDFKSVRLMTLSCSLTMQRCLAASLTYKQMHCTAASVKLVAIVQVKADKQCNRLFYAKHPSTIGRDNPIIVL